MKLSVPKGASPVSTGVVPGSEASGKVVWSDPSTEVSQTAQYLYPPAGGKLHTEAIRTDEVAQPVPRIGMLPKSKALLELSNRERTEIVDVEAIDTRIFTLPREISTITGWSCREVSRGHSTDQETSRYR